MRNKFLIIGILLLSVSCLNKNLDNSVNKDEQSKSNTLEQKDNFVDFLNLFRDIKPQKLHIYPLTRDENGDIKGYPFEGIRIDVNKFKYMDDENLFNNIQAYKDSSGNAYAIGKFEIDSNYIGLLFRVRSQYDETLIQLFLWDKKNKKIINGIDLADSFGDEGWYFNLESWIIEYKENGILKIVTRRKDSDLQEDETTAKISDTLKLYTFKKDKFQLKLRNLSDTTSYKLISWQ
ncbi:MAG: hypothetical protein NTZ33_01050 [Bacteroidetes bacterium]|nr:hypothetical protein [Bacteroidota bacterium]